MDMPETKALGRPWKVPAGLSESQSACLRLLQTSCTPLPTKLNRLFRLYSMRRNTPNANRRPSRFLDVEMGRPKLELVETARDRITIVADFPHLSPAQLFDYCTSSDLLKKWWPPAAEL